MSYQISSNRTVTWQEFAALMTSVGWGDGYDEISFRRSSRAYPLVVHARSHEGVLLGYVSAFSDGAFTTMERSPRCWVNWLFVQTPSAWAGRALIGAVEEAFPGIPVYVKALGEAKRFFETCGYRRPTSEMTVMFKKPPLVSA